MHNFYHHLHGIPAFFRTTLLASICHAFRTFLSTTVFSLLPNGACSQLSRMAWACAAINGNPTGPTPATSNPGNVCRATPLEAKSPNLVAKGSKLEAHAFDHASFDFAVQPHGVIPGLSIDSRHLAICLTKAGFFLSLAIAPGSAAYPSEV